MEIVHCNSVDELDAAIKRSGPDALFRGQTEHFEREDGTPSLTTSFSRHGCIPDLMIKWHYYAIRALRMHVQGRTELPDLPTDQAILQHYGWRSFFLDATGDARVAAWFASNKFISNVDVNLVEDCFETPVFLLSERASFKRTEGVGHVYVIGRKALRHARIGAVHLSEIATREGQPRYVCQDAYMIGPVDPQGLGVDCISCLITAPSSVLAAYAHDLSVDKLFPDPSEDPILGTLLSMPWEKAGDSVEGIGYFRRSLPIPEYKRHVTKHMSAHSAMYRPFWLKDIPQDPADPASVSHVLCSTGLYHGSSSLNFALPNLTAILSACDGILVEPQGLVYHGMGSLYGKGVIAMKKSSNLVHVCELGVEHPGLQIHGIGKFPGMHYRIDEFGTWHREAHVDDCNCGDDHSEHIRLLGRVESALSDGDIAQHGDRVYVEQGVDQISDPEALPSHSRE